MWKIGWNKTATGFVLVDQLLIATALFVFLASPAAAQDRKRVAMPDGMREYPSPYYVIYTDLPAAEVQEISLRMTKMAEEYHARTAGFAGVIRRPFPFYVFRKPEDYYAAGGMVGSAGVFMAWGPGNAADNDSRLMAIAIDQAPARPAGGADADDPGGTAGAETWHTVQHEGFHQFAHAVIGGDLPMWVNEGMAEYFGESLFTGDSFVTGVVPPRRLARVQKTIRAGGYRPVEDIMRLTQREWNAGLSANNYDQAWAMVHFLAHADGGAYQGPFVGFMNDLARRRSWALAWQNNFGAVTGFEEKWKAWWLAQSPDPTADLYVRATVSTLTSFLARATIQKQTFPDLPAFLAAAKAGGVKTGPDWLPPALLEAAVKGAARPGVRWATEFDAAKAPRVVATLPDGTRVVGSFTKSGARLGKVFVDVDDLPVQIAKARELAASNQKAEARKLLRDAIAAHPKSGTVDQARKALAEIK